MNSTFRPAFIIVESNDRGGIRRESHKGHIYPFNTNLACYQSASCEYLAKINQSGQNEFHRLLGPQNALFSPPEPLGFILNDGGNHTMGEAGTDENGRHYTQFPCDRRFSETVLFYGTYISRPNYNSLHSSNDTNKRRAQSWIIYYLRELLNKDWSDDQLCDALMAVDQHDKTPLHYAVENLPQLNDTLQPLLINLLNEKIVHLLESSDLSEEKKTGLLLNCPPSKISVLGAMLESAQSNSWLSPWLERLITKMNAEDSPVKLHEFLGGLQWLHRSVTDTHLSASLRAASLRAIVTASGAQSVLKKKQARDLLHQAFLSIREVNEDLTFITETATQCSPEGLTQSLQTGGNLLTLAIQTKSIDMVHLAMTMYQHAQGGEAVGELSKDHAQDSLLTAIRENVSIEIVDIILAQLTAEEWYAYLFTTTGSLKQEVINALTDSQGVSSLQVIERLITHQDDIPREHHTEDLCETMTAVDSQGKTPLHRSIDTLGSVENDALRHGLITLHAKQLNGLLNNEAIPAEKRLLLLTAGDEAHPSTLTTLFELKDRNAWLTPILANILQLLKTTDSLWNLANHTNSLTWLHALVSDLAISADTRHAGLQMVLEPAPDEITTYLFQKYEGVDLLHHAFRGLSVAAQDFRSLALVTQSAEHCPPEQIAASLMDGGNLLNIACQTGKKDVVDLALNVYRLSQNNNLINDHVREALLTTIRNGASFEIVRSIFNLNTPEQWCMSLFDFEEGGLQADVTTALANNQTRQNNSLLLQQIKEMLLPIQLGAVLHYFQTYGSAGDNFKERADDFVGRVKQLLGNNVNYRPRNFSSRWDVSTRYQKLVEGLPTKTLSATRKSTLLSWLNALVVNAHHIPPAVDSKGKTSPFDQLIEALDQALAPYFSREVLVTPSAPPADKQHEQEQEFVHVPNATGAPMVYGPNGVGTHITAYSAAAATPVPVVATAVAEEEKEERCVVS